MALAALVGITGLSAGLLALILGLGWPAALTLWVLGNTAGLLAALVLAALPRAQRSAQPAGTAQAA
jgi:LytS/YehU family sensor histidine kinase